MNGSWWTTLVEKPLLAFAVVGALVFKMAGDATLTWPRALLTSFSAVFCAVVFGPPVVDYFKAAGTVWEPAYFALVVLTGEHAMRFVIVVAMDPRKGIEFWHAMRGRK